MTRVTTEDMEQLDTLEMDVAAPGRTRGQEKYMKAKTIISYIGLPRTFHSTTMGGLPPEEEEEDRNAATAASSFFWPT